MSETTTTACDVCGRTETRKGLSSPLGWFDVHGGHEAERRYTSYRGWSVCSPDCLAALARRIERRREFDMRNEDFDAEKAEILEAVRELVTEKLAGLKSEATPIKKATAKKAPARPRKVA